MFASALLPTLAARLEAVCTGLRLAVRARYDEDRKFTITHLVIEYRMERLFRRLQTLVIDALAGRIAQPRPGLPRGKPRYVPERHRWPPQPLSGSFGWLARFAHNHAGETARAGLVSLLRDPALHTIIATQPLLARRLRPFCFTLGIRPEADPAMPLALHPPPRRPRRKPEAPEPVFTPPVADGDWAPPASWKLPPLLNAHAPPAAPATPAPAPRAERQERRPPDRAPRCGKTAPRPKSFRTGPCQVSHSADGKENGRASVGRLSPDCDAARARRITPLPRGISG